MVTCFPEDGVLSAHQFQSGQRMDARSPNMTRLAFAAIVLVVTGYVSGYILLGERWGLKRCPNEYCRVFESETLVTIYRPLLYGEGKLVDGQTIEGYDRSILEIEWISDRIEGRKIIWERLIWERR